jgi:D-alanyl-D-alanine carboxypeptidase
MKIVLLLLALPLLLACESGENQEQSNTTKSDATTIARIDSVPNWADTARMKGFDLAYLMGQFDPAKHPDFTLIPNQYADRANLYMRKDAYKAFVRMYEAARADDIQLTIRSAARNFDYQKRIWEGKWNGSRKIEHGKDASKAYPVPKERALRILTYSSMPGTSRHHWGTDIDLNAFNNEYFEKGQGKRVYDWLVKNAPGFGFCQPYTAKGTDRPYGYEEEKWHWSYLPIALPLTSLASEILKDNNINGFDGAGTSESIGVVQKYILGIHSDCSALIHE